MSTNQHYVSQFLLRPFGLGKKKSRTVFVFDKQDGSVCERAIKDVASESGFYDGSESGSLDSSITELESGAAPLIRRICDRASIAGLNRSARQTIALLISTQLLRTGGQRKDMESQSAKIRSILTSMNATEELLATIPAAGDGRDTHIEQILSVSSTLAEHLLNKAWFLCRVSSGRCFYISDNPVTRHNDLAPEPFESNLGIACKGIQIHLPLSPDLVLTLMCQDLLKHGMSENSRLAASILEGVPVQLVPLNVDFYNSLQVFFAERFIFASKDDFSLAQEILAERPNLRTGPRTLVIHPNGDRYPEDEFARIEQPARQRKPDPTNG